MEENAPTKATKTEIDKWTKANIKDRARLTKLEETAKEIDSIISTLKAEFMPSCYCLGMGPQVGSERQPVVPGSYLLSVPI